MFSSVVCLSCEKSDVQSNMLLRIHPTSNWNLKLCSLLETTYYDKKFILEPGVILTATQTTIRSVKDGLVGMQTDISLLSWLLTPPRTGNSLPLSAFWHLLNRGAHYFWEGFKLHVTNKLVTCDFKQKHTHWDSRNKYYWLSFYEPAFV